jgi:dipeptidyl aminopeptidase/acylaminoacyl peptidase
LSNGTLNVAWFVSNGYLVFVPDIRYYKHGFPGNCAFEAVNSAADVLSRLPFINAKQMGLQGHSFGGWETNYIVSLTNRFAAAASSGGACDLVSLNNEYNRGRSDYFESGQGRIAASLWKKPELYIHNSPIFKADKVNTPLLILHNRNDSSVPFMQANEWFNSLSHLQKRVWLLSYADEDHGLYSDKNKLDYSIRLAQFFDHFLEGAPEPAWMNEK